MMILLIVLPVRPPSIPAAASQVPLKNHRIRDPVFRVLANAIALVIEY